MLDGCQVLESQAFSTKTISLYSFLLPHTTSPWPNSSSRPEVLNFGFGHCFLSLHVLFNPRKNVWVRLADDFLHPGMPPLNMVVGSGLMLIEIVPVNGWKVSIDPGGREVVNQLINSWDAQGILLDGKPGSPGIRKWTNATDAIICTNAFKSPLDIQQLTLELGPGKLYTVCRCGLATSYS